jgi:carboxylesterase type B
LAFSLRSRDEENGSTGNYGFLEQRFAMQRARLNARAFGGDASRITTFWGNPSWGRDAYALLPAQ